MQNDYYLDDNSLGPDFYPKISEKYDFLNHFLSFNLDIGWRRKVPGLIDLSKGNKVLDACTGTGDLALEITRQLPEVELTGIDICSDMLKIAEAKFVKAGLNDRTSLITADLRNLPFPDQNFDYVTAAFGIRNVPQVEKALGEMERVTKKGGKVIVLELSMPKSRVFKVLYLMYLKYWIPLIGGLISGKFSAYRFLSQSIQLFSQKAPEYFKGWMVYPLSQGIASIYLRELR